MTVLAQAANDSAPLPAPAPFYDPIEDALNQPLSVLFAQEREQRQIAEMALALEQAKVVKLQQQLAASEAARLDLSNVSKKFAAAINGNTAKLRLWQQACAELGSGAEVYLTTPTTRLSDVTDEPLNLLQIAYVEAFDRCCENLGLPQPYRLLRDY